MSVPISFLFKVKIKAISGPFSIVNDGERRKATSMLDFYRS